MNYISALLFLGALLGATAQTAVDPSRETEARNKQVVIDFTNEFVGDKDIDAADKYVAVNVIEHNPMVPDGLEGVKATARVWFKDAKKEKIDIKRISAEGDLVWTHFKTEFLGKTVVIADISRLENGKIVEHWDVIQPITETSVNPHPYF